MKSRKSYCTTPGVGVGGAVGVTKLFKFSRYSFFYVMGKALSGELSCPCDRSCLFFLSAKLAMFLPTVLCKI